MIDAIVDRSGLEAAPVSVEAAEAERTVLLDRLRGIDAQLGQGYRLDPTTTRRLNQKEYAEWRRRALDARRHTELRYRFVKAWLHDSATANARSKAMTGDELSRAAFEVARAMKETTPLVQAAIAFTESESPETRNALFDAVGAFLCREGARK